MAQGCAAELSEVDKRFGKVVALDGLNLQVQPGELLSVLGPNGAGKSTAISLMLGLEQPDKGEARLCGPGNRLIWRPATTPILCRRRRRCG
jgi:ABC-2 type transport system ATP-binding protein